MDRMPSAAASANAESLLWGGKVAAPITRALAKDTSTGKLDKARPRDVSFSLKVRAPLKQKHI